ncbi:unnamed protein product, partial [Thlaspi arvense]
IRTRRFVSQSLPKDLPTHKTLNPSVTCLSVGFDRGGNRVFHFDWESLARFIDAPRLKYLHFDQELSPGKTISNLVSFVDVVPITDSYEDFSLSELQMVRDFFNGISRVKDMVISEHMMKLIYSYMKVESFPQFCNLTSLEAQVCDIVEILPTFLESFPNLKSIVLDVIYVDTPPITVSSVPQCLLSSLEFVEIKSRYEAEFVLMELARYFAENSVILKKIVLRWNRSMLEEDSVLRDLLALPWRSSTCEIEVCGPLKRLLVSSCLKVEPLLQFCELFRLEAKVCLVDVGILITLLESCPNLKSIVLEVTRPAIIDTDQIVAWSVAQCLLSSLEYVEIKCCCKAEGVVMKLARFFAENSVILKKLVLRWRGYVLEEDSVLRNLLAFSWRSSTYEIEVCGPLKRLSFIFYSRVEPLPQFCNLYCLEAQFSEHTLSILPRLLACCPNLKSIVLDLAPSPMLWMHPIRLLAKPQCLLSSLESVEIKSRFVGTCVEREVGRYFVENSVLLKKLVVHLSCSMEQQGLGVLRDLQALSKPSRVCQIVYVADAD